MPTLTEIQLRALLRSLEAPCVHLPPAQQCPQVWNARTGKLEFCVHIQRLLRRKFQLTLEQWVTLGRSLTQAVLERLQQRLAENPDEDPGTLKTDDDYSLWRQPCYQAKATRAERLATFEARLKAGQELFHPQERRDRLGFEFEATSERDWEGEL